MIRKESRLASQCVGPASNTVPRNPSRLSAALLARNSTANAFSSHRPSAAPLTGSASKALLEKDKRTTQTRNNSHHVQNWDNAATERVIPQEHILDKP
ncbi:hypothetical protein AVEN_219251-1 [Araneus ventricosus]|uniref:Uncharacterized protein n=1 Tax=Araneus ventricosus TaxID=182803 RepID=A0A4Y2L690_ARAVE|nr:hypothetical protein AVEN_219251-1 [Araneus ventricosus]